MQLGPIPKFILDMAPGPVLDPAAQLQSSLDAPYFGEVSYKFPRGVGSATLISNVRLTNPLFMTTLSLLHDQLSKPVTSRNARCGLAVQPR